MGTVTKRCAVCTTQVPAAAIFCSETCKELGRVIRKTQADQDEDFTLADPTAIPDDDPLVDQLAEAATRHRAAITVVLAAYVRADKELDAIIWAAHYRGLTERQIGTVLEMRTSSVHRRLLAFRARMHGPARRLVSRGA